MQHFQSHHHEAHETVWEMQHFQFKCGHAVSDYVDKGVDGGVDAAVAEEDDPAEHPADEGVYVDDVQYSLCTVLVVLVGAGQDKCEVAVVVDQQHEDTDDPLVGEVAENNQKHGEAVMERVLEEVALCLDEDVREEPAEVLARLADVEHLHFQCCLRDARRVIKQGERTSQSS